MIVKSLMIKNFLTISEADLALENKGLVLVRGENLDDPSANSNGAGKSSIPDALCWCLYGETARGYRGDAVINRKAKKNTSVTVVIQDGDDEYEIVRHRKHAKNKNALVVHKMKPSQVSLTKGTDKLTQEVVNQIMGCSLEVFRAAVYAGQEIMPDLPGMTDKALKLLIEEAAGTDRLQAAYDVARDKLRQSELDLKETRSKLDSTKDRLVTAESDLAKALNSSAEWSEKNKQAVLEQVKLAKEAEQQSVDILATLNPNKEDDIRRQIDDCRAKIDGVSGEHERRTELENVVARARREVVGAEHEAMQHAKSVKQTRQDIANVTDRIGTPCGECGKPYEAGDVHDVTENLKARLAQEVTLLKSAKATLERCQQALRSAESDLSSHEASMTDVSAVAALERELRGHAEAIAKERDRAEQFRVESKRHLLEAKRLRDEGQNPYASLIDDLVGRNKELEEERKALEQKAFEQEKHRDLVADAVKVFGPAGVRAHILDTVTPFLNDRTAEYLGILSDGNMTATWSTLATTTKGELREKFNIDVDSTTGAGSFAGLSGGEKRKVRLATSMALQDLVASRATKPISLYIADEVDHALDEAGLERLMGILDQKAKSCGTVIVISHNELSDWIREQATVTKSGGVSTVSGVIANEIEESEAA